MRKGFKKILEFKVHQFVRATLQGLLIGWYPLILMGFGYVIYWDSMYVSKMFEAASSENTLLFALGFLAIITIKLSYAAITTQRNLKYLLHQYIV